MSRRIPTKAPDVTGVLIGQLAAAFPAATVRAVKPELAAPSKTVVVRADLQQQVNDISRWCRVGISCWVMTSAGTFDRDASFDLAADIGAWLEANPTGPAIDAEVDSGPLDMVDDSTDQPVVYVTVLAQIAVT